jgi:hypothetical protein
MAYKKYRLDLSAVIDVPRELIPRNRIITEVFFLDGGIPAGVGIDLRFGQDSDNIRIAAAPIAFAPTEEDGNSGLYWLNPVAVAGQFVEFYVATRRKELEPGARELDTDRPRPPAPGFSGTVSDGASRGRR